jgi:hypothetical protein
MRYSVKDDTEQTTMSTSEQPGLENMKSLAG